MKKTRATKWIAILLLMVHLVSLTACGNKQPAPTETNVPTEHVAPTETEAHSHEFVNGLCQCGETNGLEGVAVYTDGSLTPVELLEDEKGMTLISANAAGDSALIRLDKEIETDRGHFYELVYRFTSNVPGTVRFACEGAALYEEDTFDVVAGENEIVVRFAAGQDGTAVTGLELGALDKFELAVNSVACRELTADLSDYFLDVAPEKAEGTLEAAADGLTATYKTEEGWRVKLAVDRDLVSGKTYETTFVFLRNSGKDQNVTYTVYDGAATVIGSRTQWVDSDLCVATFYLTANETVTKGTCLELGMLSGGEEASLTFTYIDFKEVDAEKLEKLLAENPFPGVNVWTEGALTPAVGTQSAEGLRFVNTNAPTDWWKVKLERDLKGEKDKFYRVTFVFDSDTEGKIKFINDGAEYVTANEYDVKKGTNTFVVDLKHGGNSYSCLELGGLGQCELLFTEIKVEEIEAPEQKPVIVNPLAGFRVWTDGSVQALERIDEAHAIVLVSENEPTDWWKIKLEKDVYGYVGQWYEVTYKFTTSASGRIKFVNDEAVYYGPNEYDVVPGENAFTVRFMYNGKPYSCLELGSLGPCTLVFTDYTIKPIPAPEMVTNGFEAYQGWTEGSMKPLTREDTPDSMTLISDNEPGDWWKVKLENNFKLEPGKTYKAVYTFTSDAAGDIKFGTNEKVTCHTPDIYYVNAGENRFEVTFTAQDGAYTCLELGGLGKFRLTFTSITLTETEAPVAPPEHTHSFVNGMCECGVTNGFAGVNVWTEGSLTPVTREDTENSMIVTSTNAPGDWWKVKVEWPLSVEEGKTYEATFVFNSDAAGTIKYHVGGAAFLDSQEYNVAVGSNTFKVRFTAGSDSYSCLELGGLGAFKLTFTGIYLTEVEEAHTHSFVNGICDCGVTNGFAGVYLWTEGSLTPLTREDTENSMIVTSTNAPGDWWKVKVEMPLSVVEGKTYEVTFYFSSNVSGTIKYHVGAAVFLDSQEYNVAAGFNTFKVRFTAGNDSYSCLELGGLGAFQLTFTGISVMEVENP